MQKLTILKIGGNVIDNDELLEVALKDFSALPSPKVLVHGGGKLATDLAKRLDIPTQMIAGRRVTDVATLQVVTMTYAGWINKQIVAKMQVIGANALGVSGVDLNLIKAQKRQNSEVDFGFVGDVTEINVTMLQQLLGIGIVPVFCAITHDCEGQLLNTNADTISSELAQSLAPFFDVTLKYCFEKKGVLRNVDDENSVIEKIELADYQLFKSEKIIHSGMIPKLDNAFASLQKGVKKIVIGDISMIKNSDLGTLIV